MRMMQTGMLATVALTRTPPLRNGEFRRGRGSDMFMRIKMLWKCFDIICFASFGGIDRHTIYEYIYIYVSFRIHRILENVKQ
jgi:hypothetical protein